MRGILIGRILPGQSALTINEPFESTIDLNGATIKALVDIKRATVSALLLNDVDSSDLGSVRNTLQAQIRKVVNFTALFNGSYHFVLLETYIDLATGHILHLESREFLDEAELKGEARIEFDHVTLNQPAISRALEAYNNALREHDYTAKYAQEAIEAVREHWDDINGKQCART